MANDLTQDLNVLTGELIVRELTNEEQAQRNAEIEAWKANKAERVAKTEQLRTAKVSAYKKLGLNNEEIVAILGLTEDEAKLLLGGN